MNKYTVFLILALLNLNAIFTDVLAQTADSVAFESNKNYVCIENNSVINLVKIKGERVSFVSFPKILKKLKKRIKKFKLLKREKKKAKSVIKINRKIANTKKLRREILDCRNGHLTSSTQGDLNPGGSSTGGSGGGNDTPPREEVIEPCAVAGDYATYRSNSGEIFSRIIQGEACTVGDSPVVFLIAYNSAGEPLHSCSGTVVSNKTIISAAHCITSSVSGFAIITGNGVFFSQNIYAHPAFRYGLGMEFNDVAVITTQSSLPTKKAKLLQNDLLEQGEQFVIAGYGLDEDGDSGTLKAGIMEVSSYNINSISAVYDGSSSNTCFGDSGGPLFVKRGTEWFLAGVTSNGTSNTCGVSGPDDISRFANLMNASNISFINSYIQ